MLIRLFNLPVYFNRNSGFLLYSSKFYLYVRNLTVAQSLLLSKYMEIGNPFVSLKTPSLNLKVFKQKGWLYLDVGFSHFCLTPLSSNLLTICSKRAIRFISYSIILLHNQVACLFRLKRFSVYKLKGLFWANRRQYLVPKVGKKQQV